MVARFFIALFSAGWIFPLWLSVDFFSHYLAFDFIPLSRGEAGPDSFPFVNFGENAFTVSSIWLAMVILFWAWRLSRPLNK
jgi:hypothetical protein